MRQTIKCALEGPPRQAVSVTTLTVSQHDGQHAHLSMMHGRSDICKGKSLQPAYASIAAMEVC